MKPRLVIALTVASLLAVFLVYSVVRGSGQMVVTVGQLRSDKDGAATKTVQRRCAVLAVSAGAGALVRANDPRRRPAGRGTRGQRERKVREATGFA